MDRRVARSKGKLAVAEAAFQVAEEESAGYEAERQEHIEEWKVRVRVRVRAYRGVDCHTITHTRACTHTCASALWGTPLNALY